MISNIQLLRAFAATIVVYFHAVGIAANYGYPTFWTKDTISWGSSGVEIFFVISGFLMVHIQQARPKSPRHFMSNRILRIVPIYWILTLTMAAIMLALPNKLLLGREFGLHTIYSLLFISTHISGPPVLYVGWTLEYEVFFYALFALGIFFGRIERGVTFVSLALCVAVATRLFGPVALEFLIGMLLALWVETGRTARPFLGSLLLVCGIAGLALGTWLMQHWPIRGIFFGLPALSMVASCLFLPQIRMRLGLLLGDASYVIYLIQVLTLPIFYKVVAKLAPPATLSGILALFAVIATLIFGVLVHLFVEKPLTQMLRRPKRPSIPMA